LATTTLTRQALNTAWNLSRETAGKRGPETDNVFAARLCLIPSPGRPVQANKALVVRALVFVLAPALSSYPLTAACLPALDA
jgi:hypothetical protein